MMRVTESEQTSFDARYYDFVTISTFWNSYFCVIIKRTHWHNDSRVFLHNGHFWTKTDWQSQWPEWPFRKKEQISTVIGSKVHWSYSVIKKVHTRNNKSSRIASSSKRKNQTLIIIGLLCLECDIIPISSLSIYQIWKIRLNAKPSKAGERNL